MRYIVLALMLFATYASAGELWLDVPVASYHTDRSKNYNETNYGLGLEYRLNEEVSLGVGRYYNSIRSWSNYIGATYTPFSLGPVKLGVVGGIINGYDSFGGGYFPVIIPTAVIEGKRMGINIVAAPPIKDNSGVIGFQLKFKLF